MLQLPIELQRQCVQFVDPEFLKSLRFVSKDALPIATEALFSTIVLQPSDESAAKYTHILESEKLNPLVRTVIFNTDDDPDADPDWASNEEKEPLESFLDALRAVFKFPNLRKVELKFARECAAPAVGRYNAWDKEVAETQSFRTDVLEAFFEGLNNLEKPAVSVDSLTVKNLQDWTLEEIYESEDFKAVRSRLKKLALQITTETEDAAPETSILLQGCHRGFTSDLPAQWLGPLQPQLTHLTLYGTHCFWGIFPFCDLRGIHFPKLKSLVLGNFTIAYDWQIDWILSHGATLEELILDDCPIVIALRLEESQKLPNFPSLDPFPLTAFARAIYLKNIDLCWHHVLLRWHHVLPRFASGLPHLRHFALGQGNWAEQEMFEQRYDLVSEIRESRYYMFDCGVGPTQWIAGGRRGAEYGFQMSGVGGQKTIAAFPDCEAEDVDALCNLLEEVGWRLASLD
ncbi:hypothetical protein BU26DRAFT_458336 [Trematosphaeria pertusa]|uniref:F-box domain-containing protein n=1 Tax=Trematosphaeria pertusa TaxID=390896 RepID=A0A6A6IC94_9PLEO|nr:uncharacterized protein BU26DRAFT_458336 [Trematosphaeria pertusa]KAF2248195.1 hypothetical protein BU26DRAFT_458336 [Trematosphaeria pertusa]